MSGSNVTSSSSRLWPVPVFEDPLVPLTDIVSVLFSSLVTMLELAMFHTRNTPNAMAAAMKKKLEYFDIKIERTGSKPQLSHALLL